MCIFWNFCPFKILPIGALRGNLQIDIDLCLLLICCYQGLFESRFCRDNIAIPTFGPLLKEDMDVPQCRTPAKPRGQEAVKDLQSTWLPQEGGHLLILNPVELKEFSSADSETRSLLRKALSSRQGAAPTSPQHFPQDIGETSGLQLPQRCGSCISSTRRSPLKAISLS